MKHCNRRPTTEDGRRISAVLIANRGEIAVRVIRACKEMGIRAIAVYTEDDRTALHVALADAAYPIDNYLNAKGIIAIARETHADAIHPGYGFLAENAAFSDATARAGIIFVGPPGSVIRRMGSKVAARALAMRAGVPMVPGTTKPVRDVAEAKRIAGSIGYPILLKAVAGGGGKGMRIVADAKALDAGFRLAANEAQAAFGDGQLYIEKYLERPHHVEVQILADAHGNIVHCFERECSVQRRHQKIIEETPSPFLKPATRAALCDAAVRFARTGKYLNAGTIEFLVDGKQQFYFLEMNTRIQVEHPITEWTTGIDLVKTQLLIAGGKPLPWRQEEIAARGHAIECRLYAENPFADFMPSPGTITALTEPHGPGVRMDTGIVADSTVSMRYDPILGKLSVWATTRDEAIARMERALQEYRIGGIVTNLAFHQAVLAHKEFRGGRYDTTFVPRRLRDLLTIAPAARQRARIIAAIAATLRKQSPLTPALSLRHPTGGHAKGEGASIWMRIARQEGVARGMAD